MSDQRRISREQVVEGLRSRSGGREVGYLRQIEQLTSKDWSPRDAGRYVELYQRSIEARSNPAAALSPGEVAEAAALEKDNDVGPNFSVFSEPSRQP